MDWRDSEQSDDEPTTSQAPASRKRSSRACDQCRKTKSKCEREGDGAQCKSCTLLGTTCTFLGPSFKRGPPKGYIRAIEQRWHQVESLLGALMQCPDTRVQTIISELRQDDLAQEILARVDSGPYGPAGRKSQPADPTKEDFFASVLRSNEASGKDASRSRRQSRMSREKVSSGQDGGLSVVPSKLWQDSLSERLCRQGSFTDQMTLDTSGIPLSQRRRVSPPVAPEWENMYTMMPESDEEDLDPALKDPTEGMGALSLDENQSIRFHGKTSGLHLLNRVDRTDERNVGGIWNLPMEKVWPPPKDRNYQPTREEDFPVELPPEDVQDRLVDLYFVYVHPMFPVLHKDAFLSEYHARKTNGQSPPYDISVEPLQRVSSLLLLSMFSLAARFTEEEMPLPPPGKMWEAGWNYGDRARALLAKIAHCSLPSTVQVLLILSYRDFGIGAMEQGWLGVGQAIRMAVDLGLHRNTDSWKLNAQPIFTPEQTQIRRQIWWGCVIADRYASIYMGRPVYIQDADFDVAYPRIPANDHTPWRPSANDLTATAYIPSANRIMSCFIASSSLALIMGSIVSKIYPVRRIPSAARRQALVEVEGQLDQWYLSLPEELRFDPTSRHNIPPPHILLLHITYWGTVVLLNRAFIPSPKGPDGVRRSPIEEKAFGLAEGAATHICSILATYQEYFSLRHCSAFMTSPLLAAGIMHVLTIRHRPGDVQAAMGLKQAMIGLRDMGVAWPSAARGWDLLNGAGVVIDLGQQTAHRNSQDRNKRDADKAFGPDKDSHYENGKFENLGGPSNGGSLYYQQNRDERSSSGPRDQDLSSRIMAHMLGIEAANGEEAASYYPSYEWWTRSYSGEGITTSGSISHGLTPSGRRIQTPTSAAAYHTNGNIRQARHAPAEAWIPMPGYSFNFSNYGYN